AEARERALVDQWLSWQSTELNPAWTYVVQAKLRGNPPNPDPTRIDASIAAWTRQMRILEDHLARSGGFMANGRFSLADIVIGLSTHRWLNVQLERPLLPAAEAHHRQMQSRPAG